MQAYFKLSTMVRKVDVCDPPKPENLAKAFSADIFFAIYFLSEIQSFASRCETFFDNLIRSMKPGAYIVCLDNGADVFIDFAKKLFLADKFDLIHEDNKIALQLSANEEKKVLGRYLDFVGKQPRLNTPRATRLIWRRK